MSDVQEHVAVWPSILIIGVLVYAFGWQTELAVSATTGFAKFLAEGWMALQTAVLSGFEDSDAKEVVNGIYVAGSVIGGLIIATLAFAGLSYPLVQNHDWTQYNTEKQWAQTFMFACVLALGAFLVGMSKLPTDGL